MKVLIYTGERAAAGSRRGREGAPWDGKRQMGLGSREGEGVNENCLAGCFWKLDSIIDFFLLRVEINIRMRSFVENVQMCLQCGQAGFFCIFRKLKVFFAKISNSRLSDTRSKQREEQRAVGFNHTRTSGARCAPYSLNNQMLVTIS